MAEYPIKTLRDLVYKITNNNHIVEDSMGHFISPNVLFKDENGNEFSIKDVWFRGDNTIVFDMLSMPIPDENSNNSDDKAIKK